MIRDKHLLQLYTSLVLSALILCLGLLSASSAIGLLRSALEKQMAEDGEIIGENLRIIIDQMTREYTERPSTLPHIQKVLETLNSRGWVGFACVLDQSGRVLAHPRSEFLDMQVPIETYEPTGLQGTKAPPIDSLPLLEEADTMGIYRTASDIIAVRWLPGLKTYLCVHQSLRTLDRRTDRLRRILALIGIGFIAIASVGAWFFVGKLVDRYESHLSRSEARNRVLVQNSANPVALGSQGIRRQVGSGLKMGLQFHDHLNATGADGQGRHRYNQVGCYRILFRHQTIHPPSQFNSSPSQR